MENETQRKSIRYQLDDQNLDGWAISKQLIVQASKIIQAGATILELGAGSGTAELRKIGRVISIEHDKTYLPATEEPHQAHLVPLDPDTGWYDRKALMAILAGQHYDLIIVDGPKRVGRHGFLHNLDLFTREAAIIIDDLHRIEIRVMADMLRRTLERPYGEYKADQGRWFAVFKSAK